MPRPSHLPPIADLLGMVRSGMSHAQIAAKISEDTGYKVARSTVSAALHRAGKAETKPRYREAVPWRVRDIHNDHYAVRMLRAYGRRQADSKLPEAEEARLEAWLRKLQSNRWVVAYCPEDPGSGFHYINAQYGDSEHAPIRTRPLLLENIAA